MKIKELFESQIIMEGISPIVYHATQINSLISIISRNEIRMSPAFTKPSEDTGKNALYFLSTTRTRTGRYHINDSDYALIELDGRKLASRYSAEPMDYWGPDYRAFSDGYEQEDRIYSDEPQIKNFMSYIKNIDIAVVSKNYRTEAYKTNLLRIVRLGKQNGFTVRFYPSGKDLVARRGEMSLQEFMRLDTAPAKVRTPEDQKADRHYQVLSDLRPVHKDDYVKAVYYGLSKKTTDPLTKEIEHSIGKLIGTWLFQIDRGSINADFHNAGHSRRANERKLLDRVSQLMRVNRLRTYVDAVEFIVKKWEGIIEPRRY